QLTLLGRFLRAGLITRAPQLYRENSTPIVRLMWTMQNLPRYFIRGVQRLLRQSRFDIIQVDYPWMIRFPLTLRTSVPKVFVAHELQTSILLQLAPSDRRVLDTIRKCEARALEEFDAVIALTPDDAAFLRDDFGLKEVYYSPLAVDCPRRPPTIDDFRHEV